MQLVFEDDFDRVVASGWGTPDLGSAWGGGANAYVNGSAYMNTASGYGNVFNNWTGMPANQTILRYITLFGTPTGATEAYWDTKFRWVDANNYYMYRVQKVVGGVINHVIYRLLAGVFTALAVSTAGVVPDGVPIRAMGITSGSTLFHRLSIPGVTVPDISATDSNFAAGNNINTAGGNSPVMVQWKVDRFAIYDHGTGSVDIDEGIPLIESMPTSSLIPLR